MKGEKMKVAARTKCNICGAMNQRENHYCVGCGAELLKKNDKDPISAVQIFIIGGIFPVLAIGILFMAFLLELVSFFTFLLLAFLIGFGYIIFAYAATQIVGVNKKKRISKETKDRFSQQCMDGETWYFHKFHKKQRQQDLWNQQFQTMEQQRLLMEDMQRAEQESILQQQNDMERLLDDLNQTAWRQHEQFHEQYFQQNQQW